MTSKLRFNIAANFVGNAWVGALSIIAVPLYIRSVGLEGYGIIGFYSTLQLLVFLLDFGLSATMNREMARFTSVGTQQGDLRDLARTLEVIYWGIGAIIVCIVGGASTLIANQWLVSKDMSHEELSKIVFLMAVSLGARWPYALYSNGLLGLQRQVLQNLIFVSVETSRVAGGIMLLVGGYAGLEGFFWWQAAVGLLGSLFVSHTFWKFIGLDGYKGKFDIAQIKKVLRFTGYMSGIGILVTILVQTDKIVLSKMLTLTDFGQYVAAGTLSSGIYLVSKPIFSAYYPEFSRLIAERSGNIEHMLFRQSYQLMSSVVVPLAAVLIVFSYEIMDLWLGSGFAAENTYQTLALLTLGTALNALMSIPYALQLAHSWVSFSFKVNLVSTILMVPLVVTLTSLFGTKGAALAWVILNVSYVVISVPTMRRYGLLVGKSWVYYREALLFPFAISLGVIWLTKYFFILLGIKSVALMAVAILFGLGLATLLNMIVLSKTRPVIFRVFRYAQRLYVG